MEGRQGKEEGVVSTVHPCDIFPIHNPPLVIPAHELRELLYRHARSEDLGSCLAEGERRCLFCVDDVGIFAGLN